MLREFDVFVVCVALLTLGVVVVSRRRALTPAWRAWQFGILLLVAGQGLHAAARLLGAAPDLVRLAAVVRLALIVPALWLLWRHRKALSAAPRSRA